jgi:hypothetical protein
MDGWFGFNVLYERHGIVQIQRSFQGREAAVPLIHAFTEE